MKKFLNVMLITVLFFPFLLIEQGCEGKNDEIKIGAIFSMTGNVAEYGQRSRKGFELAVYVINKRGGIDGKKVVGIIEDAKSMPKDAIAAYQKLVNLDNVKIIVGDVLSSTTMAIVPLLDKNKTILFAPGASNPKLRGASPYFFRNWVSDDFDGFAMANYVFDSNINQIGILVQKSDYALGLANAFEKEFKKLHGSITSKEDFETGETNFRTQITRFKSKNIQSVYLVGESKENGGILKQAKELNYNPKWFSNLTVETPECAEIAGNVREGVIFSTPAFTTNSEKPLVKEFVTEFERKYSEEPEATSGHAYDAVMIIASAIEKVGTDIEKLRKEILNIKDFPGVTGVTTFDKLGDVKKDVFIKEIRNGQSTLIKDYKF